MALRRPIIGGNWKMNKTIKKAVNTVEDLKTGLEGVEGVEIVIFPPFTALKMLQGLLEGSNIGLGAQNMYCQEKGAYTGKKVLIQERYPLLCFVMSGVSM